MDSMRRDKRMITHSEGLQSRTTLMCEEERALRLREFRGIYQRNLVLEQEGKQASVVVAQRLRTKSATLLGGTRDIKFRIRAVLW